MQSRTAKTLLATASAAAISIYMGGSALAADPVQAVAPAAPMDERTISGTVEFFAGHSWRNTEDTWDCSSDACPSILWGGEARVDVPFGDTMGMQFDLYGVIPTGESSPGDTGSHWKGNVQAGAHLYTRMPHQYLFGVFAGGGFGWNGSSDGIEIGFGGAEGQWHLNNWTLYGQAGFIGSQQGTTVGQLENAFFIRGVGRYFFNGGMTKAEGEFGYAAGDASSSDADIWWLAGEVEHQFHTFANGEGMVSGFVRGEYRSAQVDTKPASDDEPKDARVYVGFKLNMNQSNLQGRNQYGDTLDFPDIGAIVQTVCTAGCD